MRLLAARRTKALPTAELGQLCLLRGRERTSHRRRWLCRCCCRWPCRRRLCQTTTTTTTGRRSALRCVVTTSTSSSDPSGAPPLHPSVAHVAFISLTVVLFAWVKKNYDVFRMTTSSSRRLVVCSSCSRACVPPLNLLCYRNS